MLTIPEKGPHEVKDFILNEYIMIRTRVRKPSFQAPARNLAHRALPPIARFLAPPSSVRH